MEVISRLDIAAEIEHFAELKERLDDGESLKTSANLTELGRTHWQDARQPMDDTDNILDTQNIQKKLRNTKNLLVR